MVDEVLVTLFARQKEFENLLRMVRRQIADFRRGLALGSEAEERVAAGARYFDAVKFVVLCVKQFVRAAAEDVPEDASSAADCAAPETERSLPVLTNRSAPTNGTG